MEELRFQRKLPPGEINSFRESQQSLVYLEQKLLEPRAGERIHGISEELKRPNVDQPDSEKSLGIAVLMGAHTFMGFLSGAPSNVMIITTV